MPKARNHPADPPSPPAPNVPAIAADRLLGDVRALIEAAREQTARAVNSALVGLYWHIGKRIREDVLQEKRAEYGEADRVDAVDTIDRGVWAGIRRGTCFADDPVRRGVSLTTELSRHCRDN